MALTGAQQKTRRWADFFSALSSHLATLLWIGTMDSAASKMDGIH
jgi:hypothetical protein